MAGIMDTLKDGAKRFGKAALDSAPVQGAKEVGSAIKTGAGKVGKFAKESINDMGEAAEITKEGIKAANPFGGNAGKGKE